MNEKVKYKTRQRETLLAYFKNAEEEHITAADICRYCKEQGVSVGQSTVYRQLESLVNEGVLNKYMIDSSSPACFEYVDSSKHVKDGICFHCKCEKCGKLIHMHCDELEGIGKHLLEHHGFAMNPSRTVFYGVCAECGQKEGQNA